MRRGPCCSRSLSDSFIFVKRALVKERSAPSSARSHVRLQGGVVSSAMRLWSSRVEKGL